VRNWRRAIPRGVVGETFRAPFFAAVFFDFAEIFLAAMTPSSFHPAGVTMTTGSRHHAMATAVPNASSAVRMLEPIAPQPRASVGGVAGHRSPLERPLEFPQTCRIKSRISYEARGRGA
jgi:hypothetical protein